MSEKTRKQDRRTRYTRQTIKDTFLELLKQKSFTKITVTEVCKNAEINRGTFYLHYYDIYDVLSDIFNDMTQDMLTTVDHLFCLNQKSCSYPFCQKIQMESQYRALFLVLIVHILGIHLSHCCDTFILLATFYTFFLSLFLILLQNLFYRNLA